MTQVQYLLKMMRIFCYSALRAKFGITEECVCCSLPHGTMLLTSGFCADSELFSLSLSLFLSPSFPPSLPYLFRSLHSLKQEGCVWIGPLSIPSRTASCISQSPKLCLCCWVDLIACP